MAYAEMNLTVRWFLRDSNRDPRFLIRRELHLKRISDRYDLVLIDCPPLVNTCCVNALAASDYLLAPVLPSKQVTDRASTLFKLFKEFRDHLNPDLKFMGFFANRTERSAGLTDDERTRMELVNRNCKDVLNQGGTAFTAFIPRSVAIREAEDLEQRLKPEDAAHAAFAKLAEEVESRLPIFCRPNAPAQVQGVPA